MQIFSIAGLGSILCMLLLVSVSLFSLYPSGLQETEGIPGRDRHSRMILRAATLPGERNVLDELNFTSQLVVGLRNATPRELYLDNYSLFYREQVYARIPIMDIGDIFKKTVERVIRAFNPKLNYLNIGTITAHRAFLLPRLFCLDKGEKLLTAKSLEDSMRIKFYKALLSRRYNLISQKDSDPVPRTINLSAEQVFEMNRIKSNMLRVIKFTLSLHLALLNRNYDSSNIERMHSLHIITSEEEALETGIFQNCDAHSELEKYTKITLEAMGKYHKFVTDYMNGEYSMVVEGEVRNVLFVGFSRNLDYFIKRHLFFLERLVKYLKFGGCERVAECFAGPEIFITPIE